jgi:hypothetical protein
MGKQLITLHVLTTREEPHTVSRSNFCVTATGCKTCTTKTQPHPKPKQQNQQQAQPLRRSSVQGDFHYY